MTRAMHPNRLKRRPSLLLDNPELNLADGRDSAKNEASPMLGVCNERDLSFEWEGYLRSHSLTHSKRGARTTWFRRRQHNERLIRPDGNALWLASLSTSTFKELDNGAFERRMLAMHGPRIVGVNQAETLHRHKYIPLAAKSLQASTQWLASALAADGSGWSSLPPAQFP